MKTVLALDGGGVRGMFSAEILAEVECELGKRCHDLFDLIVGTSTGGILACGLGRNFTANQMSQFYYNKSQQIFSSSFLNKVNPFKPKYDGVGLEKALDEVFGLHQFNDISMNTKVMCTSFDLYLNRTVHFKSYGKNSNDLLVSDVARATSAAPTYFPAKTISMKTIVPAFGKYYKQVDKKVHVYIDGGLCANDPALHAYIEAMDLWPGEEIKLLSIGTGYIADRYNTNSLMNAGAAQWIKSLFSIFMDGAADDVDHCCKVALKNNYLRIQDQLPASVSPKMDCVTSQNLKSLMNFSSSYANNCKTEICKFLDSKEPIKTEFSNGDGPGAIVIPKVESGTLTDIIPNITNITSTTVTETLPATHFIGQSQGIKE